jgi:alpha-galactosidase
MPAARNAIQNSITRAMLHRRWWLNDPDCLLARPTTHLTLAETQSLATVIAFTGGLTLLSDDLPALPAERLELIRKLLPPMGQRPVVPGWLEHSTPDQLRLDLPDGGVWLALFNWEDEARPIHVRLADFALTGSFTARDVWSGSQIDSDDSLAFSNVSAHGCVWLELKAS